MKHTTILAFSLGLFSLLVPAEVSAKDTWTSVRSKNFTLVGNGGDKEIRRVATRLEQFRDVFTRLLPKAKFNTPVPTTVMVFKSDNSYKPFKPLYRGKPANVAGYFQSGEDVNYITLTTERGTTENPFSIIFHEYTHLLVNNNVASVPAWFNEGLAEYYSTFEVVDGEHRANLGNVISNHVYLLREKFIPLRDLLRVDHNSPLYNEREKQSIFYAESWALMHYLNLGNEGKRQPQIGVMLNKLIAGATPEDAFQQAFGTSIEAMEKELKDYVKRNSYPAQFVEFKEKLLFDAEMTSAPVTEAGAQAYLGDLLYHINRLDDAATRLQHALTLDADNAMAHSSLGMVRTRQRKFTEAKEHLQRAVTAESRNHLARYYYAYALSRESMDESGFVLGYPAETAARMRAELIKAIEINPNFPESYNLLAFVNLVTGEQLDESIELLKRARLLTPGREQFAYVLAQLYMRKQNFALARQVILPLARNSPEPRTRADAQRLLESITSIETKMAEVKRYNDEVRREAAASGGTIVTLESPDGQPMDEAAIREAMKRARADAMRSALRKAATGEEQLRGELLNIDCNKTGMTYTVKAGERTLRLHAANFDATEFKVFTDNDSLQIACGKWTAGGVAVITYRPAKDGSKKVDGELVAMEFVPADFVLTK